uniref:Uncharacterized protein n=1 Tax=Sphenodon punctatus TaxID=8508 RepID=A0A8D0GM69_SPHPU
MSEPRASCAMVSSSWAAGDEGLGTGPMPSLPGMEAAGRKRSHLLSGNGTESYAGPNGGEGPQSREEGVCPGISPLPAALLGAGQRRKLVLHIDLNNTILVSDSVTNQSPRAALNSYLSTVSWGMLSPKGEWQWLSDAPSLQPPCPGAVSFYSQYGRSARFTDTPLGRPFSGLHQHHLQLLEWPGPAHPALSTQGEHRKRYHLVLPAFFRLLESLHREGRHFAVIFRTFGTDLPRVLRAVHCALAGQHPHFPALRDLAVSSPLQSHLIER